MCITSSDIKSEIKVIIHVLTTITRLTATDVDGASNFTTANITVLPSVDNPPIANAGNAKKLVWPHNHVLLYGNASFDDNVSIVSL